MVPEANMANAAWLQVLVSILLLHYALRRIRLRRLTYAPDDEMVEFVVVLAAVVVVWGAMGLLGLLPFVGGLLGWNWIPTFMSRFESSALISSLAGFVFSLAYIAALTGVVYSFLLRWSVISRTSIRRRSCCTAGFYIGILLFDAVALVFSPNGVTSVVYQIIASSIGCIGLIALACLTEEHLFRRGVRVSLTGLAQLVIASTVTGELITKGTLHLSRMRYSELFQSLAGTLPGIAILILTITLFVPRMALRLPWAALTRQTPSKEQPRIVATPQWRVYDRTTGHRRSWTP